MARGGTRGSWCIGEAGVGVSAWARWSFRGAEGGWMVSEKKM
jgi:hypothetical protein